MAGAVFRLREQISGGKSWVRRVVRDDEQIARPGEQINRHAPDEQTLGHADVGVAGAEYFLHAANRVRAIR